MKKLSIFILAVILLLSLAALAVFAIEGEDDEIGSLIPEAQKNFVYVSDTGDDTNDGKTADKAKKTLEKAFDTLKETGGTVVVCGKLTMPASTYIPACEKDIELTSYYEGTDYQSKNEAEIYFTDTLNIKSNGKVSFYGIRLHSQSKADIYCNGTNVEFGARIDNLSDDGTYPSVYGGCMTDGQSSTDETSFSDFTLTFTTGYWHSATLGNNRTNVNAPMSNIKNASLIINGGTFLATDNDDFTTSAVSSVYPSEKINLEINGGIFYGSVYAIGSEGKIHPFVDLKYNADISVKITNGTFSGKYIKALYSKNATLDGTYTFNAEGGSYSALTYVGCEGVVGDISLSSCEAIQNKLYGFEKVVFLSKDGNDNSSGESEKSAKKTFSGAFAALPSGGSIVICSDFSITDGFVTRNTDKDIRITSKYFDADYAQTNNAKLNISGNISLRSGIAFDNILLKTDSSATFSCYGSHVEFGENVKTEGDIAVILKQREASHTFSMSSGSFSVFEFESSSTSTYISISGGSIDMFRGCTNMHVGDIFADFSGGSINGDISLAPNGVGGNVQLIVGDAQIKGGISTQRPDTDKLCEALVVYNYDKAKLSGFDIIEDKYVFVRDGALGNGSTPTLAAPTLDAALAYIGNANACVVFCGKTTYKSEYTPKNLGIITYSSIYRNIDFSSINGAKLILEADYYFDNDATIENLTIESKRTSLSFHCNSNIVIFGYGILCEIPFINDDYYISVIANDSLPASPYNDKGESISDKIIIKSGTWKNIYSSAATDILGGTVKGSVFGTKDLSNNCSITVSGGVIYGGIYASESAKEGSGSHITFTFNGGELHGVISPSLLPSTGFGGRLLINISAGDFSGVDRIESASFIGGEQSYANVLNTIDLSAYTDSYITYQNPISSKVSAITYANGMWYLAETDGGIIKLYRSNTVSSLKYTNPIYTSEPQGIVSDLSLSSSGGTMYIFAKVLSDSNEEMQVFVSNSSADTDVSFTVLGGDDMKGYISPCVTSYHGDKYLYYALENENGADIYCVKIDTALNLLSEPALVIKADRKWEMGYITSPRMLTAPDGQLYIAYTGGDVNGGSSMLGIANITSSNLLSIDSYKKNPDPVFYETESYKNIVLCNIIQIENASEPYLVYSSRVDGQHALIMQSFSYDKDNIPYFSVPCDNSMLYLSYYMPRTLTTLLEGFNINYSANVPQVSVIGKDFSLIEFFKDYYIIIISCFFVIMLVVILMVIRRFSLDPQTQFKKNQKERSRNDRRRASRLSVGKEYAANLQKLEAQATAQEQLTVIVENESETEAVEPSEKEESFLESEEIVDKISDDISEEISTLASEEDETEKTEEQAIDIAESEVVSVSPNCDTTTDQQKRKRPRPTRRV